MRAVVIQVKKKFIRQAILDSAYDLLSERGYNRTTLQDIADFAGTGVSSVYSYFPSKLHLLYAVVGPWYKEAFRRLERRVRAAKTPRAKLRAILLGVWRDIPMENIQLVQ
jgi:AcrR family transcriptional regulator